MNTLLTALLAAALAVTLGLLLRQRREHQCTYNELPTGLCVIGADNRVLRWNNQLAVLSGIDADTAIGRDIATLPDAWPDALATSLADHEGRVIKRALGEDNADGTRWIILHSSARQGSTQPRLVLVEEITDYQRMQDEMLHRERLASIGRLAAGVAHEIGNPVTGIACVAQNLADGADAEELQQGTAEILKQTQRISRIVGSLMELSHPGSAPGKTDCAPCNLADCVDEAIHLLNLDRAVPEGSFNNLCDRELLVNADNQLLLQVFLNLLDNARSAAAGAGRVAVDAHRDGEQVTVHIDNPGVSIPAEHLEQVFEPFFTTKDVGEGTGLGLPLVRRALESMGGSIALISPAPGLGGGGTRAQLSLHRAEYPTGYDSGTAAI